LGAVLVRGLNAFSRGALICAVRRRKLNPAERAGYRAPYDSWAHRIATLRFVQDIPLRSGDPAYALVSRVEEELSKLAQVPALICWGEKDLVFDHHFLSEWERHLPRAVVHRFRDCGHYVLEDARDEIAGLVQGFLEEARGNG
jgi:pimeloyl-ACP methyl ester carboxylesterase